MLLLLFISTVIATILPNVPAPPPMAPAPQPKVPAPPPVDFPTDAELQKLGDLLSDCQTIITTMKQLKTVKTMQDYAKLIKQCGILKLGLILEPPLLNVSVKSPAGTFIYNQALPTKAQFEKLLDYNVKNSVASTLHVTKRILDLTLLAGQQGMLKLMKTHVKVPGADVTIPGLLEKIVTKLQMCVK